jgi:hypothetical protein
MRTVMVVMLLDAVKLTQILNSGSPVRGITVLYERLYVLRENSAQLEVYDINTFRLIQRLTMPGLGDSYSMASSLQCSCLFIPDWSNSTMYRVNVHDTDGTDAHGSFVTQWWPVRDRPYGVSVNSDGHVVVVCPITRTIKIFTITGVLMRSIDLPAEVKIPWHATQAVSGNIYVSHGDEPGYEWIREVDDEGKGIAVGTELGNDRQQMLIGTYWKFKAGSDIYLKSDFQNTWILLARPLELRSEGSFQAWICVRQSFSCVKKFNIQTLVRR